MSDAAVRLAQPAERHQVDHGRVYAVGDAQLELHVHVQLALLRAHRHARHRAELRGQRTAQILDDERLACAWHVHGACMACALQVRGTCMA